MYTSCHVQCTSLYIVHLYTPIIAMWWPPRGGAGECLGSSLDPQVCYTCVKLGLGWTPDILIVCILNVFTWADMYKCIHVYLCSVVVYLSCTRVLIYSAPRCTLYTCTHHLQSSHPGAVGCHPGQAGQGTLRLWRQVHVHLPDKITVSPRMRPNLKRSLSVVCFL